MERQVQSLLERAEQHSTAFLWRRISRDLSGPVRVALCGVDLDRLQRAAAAMPAQLEPVVVWVEVEPDLGVQDLLLSCHAAVWVSSMLAPVSAVEREMMAELSRLAPAHRGVVLADAAALERMSDDPEAERAQVDERVRALLDPSWPLLEHNDFVAALPGAHRALRDARRQEVARVLLQDARDQCEVEQQVVREGAGRVDALLESADAELETARLAGRRAAAHFLGIARKHTEQLSVDFQAFLVELEADLPAELEAVDDTLLATRTLGHWLDHVVEQWLHQRLVRWRTDVLEELQQSGLDDSDLHYAFLLVPALQAPPVRGGPGWSERLGTTAALGSAAALLAFGLWLPGLLALTTGLAWSAVGRTGRDAQTRLALLQSAVGALREVGRQAKQMLHAQVEQLELDLAALGETRAGVVEEQQAEHRAQLEAERAKLADRAAGLDAVGSALGVALEELA